MLMLERNQNLIAPPSRTVSGGLRRDSSELKGYYKEWPEMPSPHPPRIDVLELKVQIIKRVGSERANRYFSYFRSFIGSRLSKQELDKLVVVTIGRENLALHNQLIKAIISNAVRCSHGPPLPPQDASKSIKGVRSHKPPLITIDEDVAVLQPFSCTLSNGDSFLSSPHSGRPCSLPDGDHRANKGRPSPLGPREEHLTLHLSRPMQKLEDAAKQLDALSNTELIPPLKRIRVHEPMSTENGNAEVSGLSGLEGNFMVKDDRKKVLPSPSESIQAPLGVAFRSGSLHAAARRLHLQPFPAHLLLQDGVELLDAMDLPDAETMQGNMEIIATAEGLEGVGRDCAEILNLALDSFLKRLMKACVDLVGSRARTADHERMVHSGTSGNKNLLESILFNRSLKGKNGVWPGPASEIFRKDGEKNAPPISLMDFKAAMDLNPQQLGEDWPVQLEKISFRTYDQ